MTIRSISHVLNSVIYRSVCVCGHAESMYHTYIMYIYIYCVCVGVCACGATVLSVDIFRKLHAYLSRDPLI